MRSDGPETMKEDRLIFERALRKIEKPALEALGFKFDQRRTFRKTLVDGTSWEVQFQLGVRFMQGEFTVNLAHHRPGAPYPLQERIGAVRKTRWVRMLRGYFQTQGPSGAPCSVRATSGGGCRLLKQKRNEHTEMS